MLYSGLNNNYVECSSNEVQTLRLYNPEMHYNELPLYYMMLILNSFKQKGV